MIHRNFIKHTDRLIYQSKNKFYFKPHPLLSKYVSHYAISFSPQLLNEYETNDLFIIPDASGCLYYRFTDNNVVGGCWGPTTQIVNVKKSRPKSNEVHIFIEFLPGGLYALLNYHLRELKDKQFLISDLDKELSKSLRNTIEISKDSEELFDRFDSHLFERINKKHNSLTVYSVLRRINESGGNISVKDLAIHEYISERNLSRIFDRNIGLSIKTFERLLKINRMVKEMKKESNLTLSHISQNYGYFDQSHFIRDFKEICEVTPSLYTQNQMNFYNEALKF